LKLLLLLRWWGLIKILLPRFLITLLSKLILFWRRLFKLLLIRLLLCGGRWGLLVEILLPMFLLTLLLQFYRSNQSIQQQNSWYSWCVGDHFADLWSFDNG